MATVDSLIKILRADGIKNNDVLNAIKKVPREHFMDPKYAYENAAFGIGSGQTISQPYIVALMTELLLDVSFPVKKILEIGTGSGYQAAILSTLVEQVYSVERIKSLYEQANERLKEFKNIHLRHADGLLGWPEEAPFDGILVTASATEIPVHLLEQLRPDARLIIPIGNILKVVNSASQEEDIDFVAFVPLVKGTS